LTKHDSKWNIRPDAEAGSDNEQTELPLDIDEESNDYTAANDVSDGSDYDVVKESGRQ
jgi:hypothetical protein